MPTNGKPTVISTFAGTGGSSLGYHMAGFQELLAIDFDEHAVKAFKANFPDVPVWKASVTDVQAEDILRFCKIEKGQLDVFDGSPPCQGFSLAGDRNVRDDRNDLFKHYSRLVDGLQPKVFVMENVPGMVRGKMKGKFIEIIQHLKSMNYQVKAKILNSMYYGVPQRRERIFFIGVRSDLNKEPIFPTAKLEIMTFSKALEGLKNVGQTPNISLFAKTCINKLKPGESLSKYHPKGHLFGSYRARVDTPIRTLLKESTNQIYHPIENRCLGINELKVLCSFPENWILDMSYHESVARLGNAVMPLQMKAIAETIAREILGVNEVS